LRPSEVPAADVDGRILGSPFRLTDGAARTVSCAHSLHGLFEMVFFVADAEEAFEGPTVGVVVAERFDAVVADLVDDIVWCRTLEKIGVVQISKFLSQSD